MVCRLSSIVYRPSSRQFLVSVWCLDTYVTTPVLAQQLREQDTCGSASEKEDATPYFWCYAFDAVDRA